MKRIGIILFLIAMTLVSCSDDDDNTNVDSLIGTWEFNYSEDGAAITQLLTFNANKTGTILITITYLGETESETEDFTWSATTNKLTLLIGGESEVVNYSIAGNKLTVTFDGESIVFTRK